ncbi:MAG: hypothetical protein ACRDGE_02525 [Candidatus Limnocylindria bacterium]
MPPELLRGGFRIAVLVLLAALAMLPFQDRGSAEFYVSLLAAVIGGLFVLAIALAVRAATPRPPASFPHGDRPSERRLNEPAAGEAPGDQGRKT